MALQQRYTAHTVHYVRNTGPQGTRLNCICNGKDRTFLCQTGMMWFQAADNQVRTYVGSVSAGDRFATLLIPIGLLQAVAYENGVGTKPLELKSFANRYDPILQCLIERLLSLCERDPNEEISDHSETVAREFVLRLFEISCGKAPAWQADHSGFDAQTFGSLLDAIDTQLAAPPNLAALSRRVALSPSHFARKFRNTTGQSLHRFINTRRMHAALRQIASPELPVARLAYDLGFSSQSHFTRIFRATTGMTPARFRSRFAKNPPRDDQKMPNAPWMKEHAAHRRHSGHRFHAR
jgi:AraC-like DNA-binding protein